MSELFLGALENALHVKHTKLSLIEKWSLNGLEALRGTELTEYLGIVSSFPRVYLPVLTQLRVQFLSMIITTIIPWTNFVTSIRLSLANSYMVVLLTERGGMTSISADICINIADSKRARGEKITDEQRDNNLERIKVFKEWSNKKIWQVDDPEDAAIIMVPQGRPGANYKNAVSEGFLRNNSYTPLFTTSMIGCPQLVVPSEWKYHPTIPCTNLKSSVGQNPYDSRVSDHVEYAPIMTSFIGLPSKFILNLTSQELIIF
jgi:hypothetical protein